MRNLFYSLLAVYIFGVGFGCQEPAPPPAKFKLDRPFPLKLRQTGAFADNKMFTVKFEKITADTRCPLGMTCDTTGRADVVLTLSLDNESQTTTLKYYNPNGTTNVVDFKGYTIRVLGVAPFQIKDQVFNPESYVLTLSVINTPPPAPTVKIGTDFALAVGENIVLADDPGSSIRFDSVTNDSRCAVGTQCIWAGRADCKFSLTTGGQTQTVTLAAGDLSQGGAGEAKFGPYTLKIKALGPSKQQGQTIPQKDYKAMLTVSKS